MKFKLQEDYTVSFYDIKDILQNVFNIIVPSKINSIESIYSFAFDNGIMINDIIWQEYKDYESDSNVKFLSHGSRNGIIGDIRLDIKSDSKDFGDGFYCGTELYQAGMFVSGNENSSIYIIEFNPNGLKPIRFGVNTDWMLAVAYYRNTLGDYKNHNKVINIINNINKCDYVIAPIADNRMFETIDLFTSGKITDKQCLYALSSIHLGYQYVFKKNSCLKNLNISDHLYLCQSEKDSYIEKSNVEYRTSLNKAMIAKYKFKDNGKYIGELLGN